MTKVYVISEHQISSHDDIDLDTDSISVVKVVNSEAKAIKFICERIIEACDEIDDQTIYIDPRLAMMYREIRKDKDIYIVTDTTHDCTLEIFYSYESYVLE